MTFKPTVSHGLCQLFPGRYTVIPDRIHSMAGMTMPAVARRLSSCRAITALVGAMRGSGAHGFNCVTGRYA